MTQTITKAEEINYTTFGIAITLPMCKRQLLSELMEGNEITPKLFWEESKRLYNEMSVEEKKEEYRLLNL